MLEGAASDDRLLHHKAWILLGRFALAEGDRAKALDALAHAHRQATEGDLEAIWWDRALVRKLLAKERTSQCRDYLEDMLDHARRDDAAQVADEAREMLQEYDSGR